MNYELIFRSDLLTNLYSRAKFNVLFSLRDPLIAYFGSQQLVIKD